MIARQQLYDYRAIVHQTRKYASARYIAGAVQSFALVWRVVGWFEAGLAYRHVTPRMVGWRTPGLLG